MASTGFMERLAKAHKLENRGLVPWLFVVQTPCTWRTKKKSRENSLINDLDDVGMNDKKSLWHYFPPKRHWEDVAQRPLVDILQLIQKHRVSPGFCGATVTWWWRRQQQTKISRWHAPRTSFAPNLQPSLLTSAACDISSSAGFLRHHGKLAGVYRPNRHQMVSGRSKNFWDTWKTAVAVNFHQLYP